MPATVENIPDEFIAHLRKEGFSEKSIRYYLEQVNLGEIEYPDIKHIEIGEHGDIMIIYMNLCEGPSIQDIKFNYLGCPGLASSCSSMTMLATGKKISEALELSDKDILIDLEGLPESHHHCPVLAVNTLKTALNKATTYKLLTGEEHDEYIHLCGLSGKKVDELPTTECDECEMVKRCEKDHMILRKC
jgi:NifU-like protein involved in Fe-S cluster formation